jgi:hypothetical protein
LGRDISRDAEDNGGQQRLHTGKQGSFDAGPRGPSRRQAADRSPVPILARRWQEPDPASGDMSSPGRRRGADSLVLINLVSLIIDVSV